MSFKNKYFKNSQRKKKLVSTEEQVKNFVLRNSKNGYYTKVSTLPHKFEIPEDQVWQIVGELLNEGLIESIHDEKSGEMKLCETGKIYSILNLDRQRKREKLTKNKKLKTTTRFKINP